MFLQLVEKVAIISNRNRETCAVFGGILSVVEILNELGRELENCNNADSDAKRIHVKRKVIQIVDADRGAMREKTVTYCKERG